MPKENRKYVILTIEDVEDVDFDQVMQDSPTTLRISLDGKYTFVKFEGDTRSFLVGKTQYTYEEFKPIVTVTDGLLTPYDIEQATSMNKLQYVLSCITLDKLNPFNWFS